MARKTEQRETSRCRRDTRAAKACRNRYQEQRKEARVSTSVAMDLQKYARNIIQCMPGTTLSLPTSSAGHVADDTNTRHTKRERMSEHTGKHTGKRSWCRAGRAKEDQPSMRITGTTVVEKEAGARSTAPSWVVVHPPPPGGGASNKIAALDRLVLSCQRMRATHIRRCAMLIQNSSAIYCTSELICHRC